MITNGGATNTSLDSQILDVVKYRQLYGDIFDIDPHLQNPTGYQFASSIWEHLQPSNKPSTLAEIEWASSKKRSKEEIINEGKKSKRRKAAPSLQQSSIINHQKSSPVRRSQKLNDKITALQKLVSPYGKTDTASVLEEADLYINLLQHKIQNLYRMLSKPSSSQEKDLQYIGLCLFPVSVLNKLIVGTSLS